MGQNAAVSWVLLNDCDARRQLEHYLIRRYNLPLNSEGNRTHPFYKSLSTLRRKADLRTGTSSKRTIKAADWREDAITWIRIQAAKLAPQPADRWEVGRPTDQARETAIQLIEAFGPESPAPSALLATLSEGIELEWRRGDRLLSVEIMADGTLESLKSVSGQPIAEERLDEGDSRIHSLLSWLDAA